MATASHLRLPLQVGASGTFRTVEQDSDEDVIQGILVLLSTPLGRQVEQPAYGLRPQLFRTAVDTGDVHDAVEAWQPRARVAVGVQVNTLDELVQHVQVGVDRA